jgi:acyl-CoA synthetase (NDP forming)
VEVAWNEATGLERIRNAGVRDMNESLIPFLEPRRIAIIGVSRTPERPGYMIISNLKDAGFAGEVYPVNPSGGEILGLRIFKNVGELPENIDLAVSMIPAEETLELLRACVTKGIRNIVLVSSGFSESGPNGARLQGKIVHYAKEKGIRIMGPNAVGPVNTSINLVLPFYPLDSVKRGGVAFIAQSGQFSCPVMEFANSYLHLGVSKSIDVGNCSDLDESDLLEYLERDIETKVIAIYMESIRAGRSFLEVAKRVSKKKPVVIFKSGKTEAGLKTAASHTGAMAVNDSVFDAALRQAGVIRAKDLDEFLDLAKIFDYAPVAQGKRLAVVTYSGGVGSMVADACDEFGLELAKLSEETIEKIRRFLLPSTNISNPLDCFSAGVPANVFDAYKMATLAFSEAPNIDLILSCFVVNRAWTVDANRLLDELKPFQTKPMAAWVMGEYGRVRDFTEILEEGGIPVFASPERAVKALGALWRYSKVVREN